MSGVPLSACLVSMMALAASARAQLPSVSPGGKNMMLGSNLGLFDTNDSFTQNAGERTAAGAVLGAMRFPARYFTTNFVAQVADQITAQGMVPLVVLSAADHPQDNVSYVAALVGKAEYFEFGNENNYANGWSGAQYAAAWRQYVPLIRQANPNAKVGGPVGSHFDANGSQYARDFLNAIKNDPTNTWPDFISVHVYVEHGEDLPNQTVINTVTSAWGPGISRIQSDVRSILGISLPVAVTEWNWDALPENSNDTRGSDPVFMHSFVPAVLDTFEARGVWMANQYRFTDGLLAMWPGAMYNEFVAWDALNPVNGYHPQIVSIEAENMTLTNYLVNANSSASGGNLIKLSAGGVTGTATVNFPGSTGTYDIKVWYYDESDGACTLRIYAAGALLDEWIANQDLGSIDPVAQTRTDRIETGVSIANGAQIKLEAVQNAQEWGRFDVVQFIPVATVPTASQIVRVRLDGADVLVSFTTVAGRHYRLESADAPIGPSWNVVVPDTVGTGAIVTVTNTGGFSSANRFYRVVDFIPSL
jgi:Glycosyl hydrolase catalytic core